MERTRICFRDTLGVEIVVLESGGSRRKRAEEEKRLLYAKRAIGWITRTMPMTAGMRSRNPKEETRRSMKPGSFAPQTMCLPTLATQLRNGQPSPHTKKTCSSTSSFTTILEPTTEQKGRSCGPPLSCDAAKEVPRKCLCSWIIVTMTLVMYSHESVKFVVLATFLRMFEDHRGYIDVWK
jgi:hypothetical protein